MEKLKFFLRGVGVALIITTTFFYILMNNNVDSKKEQITDEVIIQRAKELGMVFIKESNGKTDNLSKEDVIKLAREFSLEVRDVEEKNNENPLDNKISTENQSEIERTDEIIEEITLSEEVNITIPSGFSSYDIAELLYKHGIIENTYDFNSYIIINKYDRKLQPGKYIFKKGSNYDEIIKKITNY